MAGGHEWPRRLLVWLRGHCLLWLSDLVSGAARETQQRWELMEGESKRIERFQNFSDTECH